MDKMHSRSLFARAFISHPTSVNETYLQHGRVALSFAGPLFLAACAALLHAIIPGAFEKTASTIVRRLHARMDSR